MLKTTEPQRFWRNYFSRHCF